MSTTTEPSYHRGRADTVPQQISGFSRARLEGAYFYNGYVKRAIDVLLAITALPAIVLFGVVLVLINPLANPGPLIYSQRRVGRDGKPFVMYKFRSMVGRSNGTKFVGDELERVSALGGFIRYFHFDELPQFFNVIKGDMSLIGPRPEQEEFVKQFSEEILLYDLRHVIRPGLTGLAQVRSGYADDLRSTELKLQYDLEYVQNLGIVMDCKIAFRTVYVVLTGFGVR